MKLSASVNVIFCVLLSIIVSVQSYKILVFFPIGTSSQYILGSSLAKGLVKAGHDVTIIAAFEDKNPPTGKYRQIILPEMVNIFNKVNLFESRGQKSFMSNFLKLIDEFTENILNSTQINKLLKNSETFDAMVMGEFPADSMRVYAHLFKAHLISLSSVGPNSIVNELTGNPSPLAYISEASLGYSSRMTFFQRLKNVFASLMHGMLKHFLMLPKQREALKKFYPKAPDFDQVRLNASLVLLNSNVATLPAVALVPNMIPIGGFHLQPAKPLPKDLKNFLDNAKEGVIYFSMGSILNTNNIPKEKTESLLSVFRQLKQKVLWKLNEDIPEKSENVKIEKWLPQEGILAHPNVKLFITHAGLLSTIETISHGKPVLAVPIFGDQPMNAQQIYNNGLGLIHKYDDLEKSEELLEKIKELLTNPRYFNVAQQRSKILNDQPLKPLETAVYWIEYVIRHNGAHHLRVVGAELPWYKLYLVDVAAFLISTLVLSIKVVLYVCKRCICRKNVKKLKHQ